jgi:hypothetical protein
MENFRKIKMSKKYIRNRWDSKFVPSFILAGDYLSDAGFVPGQNCSVKIESGRITILAL